MKPYFICIIFGFVVNSICFAQFYRPDELRLRSSIAITANDQNIIYEGDSLSAASSAQLSFGSLVRVLSRSEAFDTNPEMESEYNTFFWYQVEAGDQKGWMLGSDLYFADTSYVGKSEYTNVYQEGKFIPHSIHYAQKRSFKVEKQLNMQKAYPGFGSSMESDEPDSIFKFRPQFYSGGSVFFAMIHPDEEKVVDGSEQVIPIWQNSQEGNQILLSAALVWEIADLMALSGQKSQDLVMTLTKTNGQSYGSVEVLELKKDGNEYIVETLFKRDNK